MSYILDALRKADAQRERDPARGIHAQAAGIAAAPAGEARAGAAWLWPLVGVLAVLAAAGAWYAMEPADAPAPATQVATANQKSPAPLTPPVVAAITPPAPAPAVAVQPPPVAAPSPAPRSVPPRDPTNTSQPNHRGTPQVPQSGLMAPRGVAVAPLPGTAPPQNAAPGMRPPANASAPGGGVAAGSPAPQAVQSAPVAGLPGDAPKLTISGGVYSTSPAQRMLIVNGQVFNEGSEVASGVTLDEIRPKLAVLRFKGVRYTVGF